MTPQDSGAGVTEMTVSVQVMTVDGTRRMSHRFFEQIPAGTFLDDNGDLADDAHPWGSVSADEDTIVGTRAGKLIRMTVYTAEARVGDYLPRPEPYSRDDAAWALYRAANERLRKAARDTFEELLNDLPQLYLGG